jgi:UDP-N-acetylmuramoylalanine--D-glutamate ligase
MQARDYLHKKTVLVVGFARQGQALARWLPTMGAKTIVTDSRYADALGINPREYPDAQLLLGVEQDNSLLKGVDLICVSGGVPLDIPLLQEARDRNIRLTNDAELFLERCPAPVIGITGSAGKTTTTRLVGAIMERAGYKTWVGGNIGDVLLDVLAQIEHDDVVVMELSSFQLELMQISPQIAAIINLTPNHLDRHGTMEAYINAKANIIRHQRSDNVAILNADNDITAGLEPMVQGELVTFSDSGMVPNGAFTLGDRLILAGAASYDMSPHVLVTQDEIPLRGEHNRLNILAACAIAGSFGLAANRPGIPPEVLHDAIVNFEAVPHRLETVAEINGVTYVNDSIATAPERLMAALHSFDEPLIVLVGGADKELEWQKVMRLALRKSRHIIIFGKVGDKQVRNKVIPLLKLMGANEKVFTVVESLEEAMQRAVDVAQEGDVVLLSPGGTSYDSYPDFAARGEHFRQLVKKLQ